MDIREWHWMKIRERITENYTYTFFFLLKRNDRHVKADYRIDLSTRRYERVIDYVLS